MTEAWDDILLEMDSKLLKFAEEKHVCGNICSCIVLLNMVFITF